VGFRFYKSVGLGRGVRLNLSKTGVGTSAGIPGLRYSVHSSGRSTRTAGLPGTGLYYRKDSKLGSGKPSRQPLAAPPVQMYPKAGLFALKDEKLIVKGVTAYMQGRLEEAVTLLRDAAARDTAEAHVAEELFLGVALVGLQRLDEAAIALKAVIESDCSLPDQMMSKYGIGGHIEVGVTPTSTVAVPMSTVGAALLLAEVHQRLGHGKEAIDLLESLGSITEEPVFALSLAELYGETEQWQEVARVTEGFPSNGDDLALEILCRRASALGEMGMHAAALQVLKEALRFRRSDQAYASANSRHDPGTPLSSCSPRSSNSMPEPASRSLTVLETSTSPASALPATRAPIWTARPPRSAPRTSTSPVWTPARIWIPSEGTAWQIARAHRTARAGLSKVAKNPSPVVAISRPPKRSSSERTMA
jgi:tetratricopeptide (TPR) repeat protein